MTLNPDSLFIAETVLRLWTLTLSAFALGVVGMGLLILEGWRMPRVARHRALVPLRGIEPAAPSRPFGFDRLRGVR